MSSCTNRIAVFYKFFSLICSQPRDKQNRACDFLLFNYFLNNLISTLFMQNSFSKHVKLLKKKQKNNQQHVVRKNVDMILCCSLWEMCVQKFKVDLFNLSIKFSLNTFLIKLPSVKFLLKFYISVVKQICNWKVNIWALLEYFLFLFFCWNEIKKKILNKRIQEKNGRTEMFLAEVIGNSISDHYARNIYIKVFLIAALWILVRSNILYYKISKFAQKYLQ